MKLSFIFLCLSLVTLSLAAIPSAKKKGSLSRKENPKSSQSSQATKEKSVRGGKRTLKKRLKKRAGATKGLEKASAGAGTSSQEGCAAKGDRNKFALDFFPKVLVELIGGYLEGSYSVVFTRDWSAAFSFDRVAVDSERHYLITKQGVQASSHGDGKPVNLGSPDLSHYDDFCNSHDGRYVFFTGKSQKQVSSGSNDRTVRWLVQDTGTKSLKSVTLESGEIYDAYDRFMLSTNGKTLVSTSWVTSTTSVYQIEEHGKTASVSKKANFDRYAGAVSRNSNRILMEYTEKKRFEIHDVSGDESQLVLEISYAGATSVGICALNNDGSKAAFIVDKRKLCIVDVGKQKGSISVDQLIKIDVPDPDLSYSLIYDAEDRLYAFGWGSLWLVEPSKPEFISLEKVQDPQGYGIQSFAVSPNSDYIALLFRSLSGSEKREFQYRMVVKRNTKDPFMRLCGH